MAGKKAGHAAHCAWPTGLCNCGLYEYSGSHSRYNSELVEALKVWYSVFTVVMDDPAMTTATKMDKCRQLREELRRRVPTAEPVKPS